MIEHLNFIIQKVFIHVLVVLILRMMNVYLMELVVVVRRKKVNLMNENEVKNPDYDKMIAIINNMSEKELQYFLMMAQTIQMEKNILCGAD